MAKKKSSTPKRKHYNRNARLQSGKTWLKNFKGKNLIRSYRRWYAVSEVCAVIELQLLGISFKQEVLEKAKLTEKDKANSRSVAKNIRKEELLTEQCENSDDHFSFIAGYTSNGVPYGAIWDETDNESL